MYNLEIENHPFYRKWKSKLSYFIGHDRNHVRTLRLHPTLQAQFPLNLFLVGIGYATRHIFPVLVNRDGVWTKLDAGQFSRPFRPAPYNAVSSPVAASPGAELTDFWSILSPLIASYSLRAVPTTSIF